MHNKKTVRFYTDFSTDFYDDGKAHPLPPCYRWIREGRCYSVFASLLYGVALLFSVFYCRLFLGVRIRGKEKLSAVKGKGFFLYGNHTQPVGDVFSPALVCFPRRIYTIVSPANLAIPVIGKLLPALGALPLAQSLEGTRRFRQAIEYHIQNGHPIILYPEAHVWDYYTEIRPFDVTSFKLPIRLDAPAFCMTTTYQKCRLRKRPRITVFLDGPFWGEGENPSQKSSNLHRKITDCMNERAKASNLSYITYRKKEPSSAVGTDV